jgi:hypothetical protein
MGDDLKISDMVEVTAGNLHDDLQFEVIDPNEAAVEDQNKRVKLVTLEASFGAEDKIFEGDSSVEIVDTGTGEVIVTVDGGEVGHYTASGLRLGGAGARVDEIETALTDDDTHLPTSGAVIDAISGTPNGIFFADSGGLPDTNTKMTFDPATGNILLYGGIQPARIRITGTGSNQGVVIGDIADTETWIEIGDDSGTPFAKMAASLHEFKLPAGDPAYWQSSDCKITLDDSGSGVITFAVNSKGNIELTINDNGIQLASGATVDEIETTLTDDDTHLPTSGAVVDALVADVKDIISEGNSSVEVIDAGTGQIDSTVDGSLKATMNVDGLQLKGDQTGGEAIGNAASTVAITFGTAHADANYQVLATVENITDGGPLVLAAIITAKATTGFTATLSAATDSVNYVLNWLVVRS